MRIEKSTRSHARSLLASLSTVAFFVTAAPSLAQDGSFGSATDVTAVDVLVDITRSTPLPGIRAEVPQDLAREDFSILVDGDARPIVDLEASVTSERPTAAEPWRVVLYLDTVLHGDKELRWAAKLWAGSLDKFLALGRVELVIADPDPRTVHQDERGSEELATALARLSLEATGEGQLTLLREESLVEEGDGPFALEDPLFPRDSLAAETALVQHRLDTLLVYLSSSGSQSSRKALLWGGGAFEIRPEVFYQVEIQEPSLLEDAASDVARALAAYGWVVLPVASPLPENRAHIKPGIRIGKLRFSTGNDLGLPGFTVAFEEERDAKKAEAHVALAEVLAEQEKNADAIEELQKALHHYYGDPRTADRQAQAYTRLGDLLSKIGEEDQARRAYEAARELTRGDLDPKEKILAESETEALNDRPAGVTEVDPTSAFELLAETTAGFAIRDTEDLEQALQQLPRRQRVTFQVEGPVSGRLQPLEVRLLRKGLRARAPLWMRHGTPDTLAVARARSSLLGDLQGATEELTAWVEEGDEEGETTLVVPRTGPWKESQRLRLTIAKAGFDGLIDVEHQRLEGVEAAAEALRFPFPLNSEKPFLAVVLEDLTTGHWAVRIIDQD